MNEQVQPDNPVPAPTADEGAATQPVAPRSRWRPRGRAAATAATSRTAGWLVAAALAGSLVTLLLTSGGRSPGTITLVPAQRAAFSGPGGGAVSVPGRKVGPPRSWSRQAAMPPGARVIAPPFAGLAPGGQWVIVRNGRAQFIAPSGWMSGPPGWMGGPPGWMSGPRSQRLYFGPGMQVRVPAMRAACGFAGLGPPAIKRMIVGRGKHGMRFTLVQPRAAWRVVIGPGRHGVRLPIARLPRHGKRTIFWAGPGGPARQIVIGPRGMVVVGPVGLPMCGMASRAQIHGQVPPPPGR